VDLVAKILVTLAVAFSSSVTLAASGTSLIQALVCGGPPAAPTIVTPVDGSTTTTASTPVSGLAPAGSTVTVYNGSTSAGSTTAAGDGSYSVTAPLALGPSTFHAVASNGCGTSGDSNYVTVTRIQVAPSAPQIDSPANGTATTAVSVVVSGTAEPGSLVEVQLNGQPAGSVTVDSNGNFSLVVGLPVGANTLTATATNAAGTSPSSSPVVVTRMLPPPPEPGGGSAVATPPSSGAPTVAITSPGNGATVSAPTVTVAGTAPAGVVVSIFVNGQLVAQPRADTLGLFQVNVPLPLGTSTIQARLPDGSVSNTIQVTRVQSLPLAPQINHPANGAVVSSGTLVVEGDAQPGMTVIITIDGREVSRVIADANGRFQVSIQLHHGANRITAIALNDVGQAESAAVIVTYQVESAAGKADTTARSLLGWIVMAIATPIVIAHEALRSLVAYMAGQPYGPQLLVLAALCGCLLAHGLPGIMQLIVLVVVPWHRRDRTAIDEVTGAEVHLVRWKRKQDGIDVSKPGYRAVHYAEEPTEVILRPTMLYASRWYHLGYDILWIMGWLAVALGVEFALWLTAHGQMVTGISLGISIGAMAVGQFIVGHYLPKTRWGVLVTDEGEAVGEGVIELHQADTGAKVAETPLEEGGHFALYASAGHYVVRAQTAGATTSAVVKLRRPGYITTRLVIKTQESASQAPVGAVQ